MAVTQFGQFGLDDRLLEALEKHGLIEPTPIQAKAISPLMDGKDVLGIAQTGTGKTAAFVLPMMQKVLEQKGAPEKQTVRGLIVVPTRELANQVADTVRKLAEFTNISCFTVVGGAKADPQIRALKKGLDILVATPGRLEDHLNAKVFSLSSTMMIALDEADQMLDMGFIPAIRRIMAKMPQKKQAALFSATMPPMIKDLAAKFMYRPQEVSVAPANKPIESIEQRVYGVAQSRKQSALIEQLSQPEVELALVFVRTKRGADRVQRVLDKAGIASQAIHGDRSQGQRERALRDFRSGRTRILVATDVAARGIDVPNVSHVFNFDLPQQAEAYVHRIGRTARAGASGVAITFMNPTERDMLAAIERITKRKFKIIPLKVADQTADINANVQAEQAAEEKAVEEAKTEKRDQVRSQAQAEAAFDKKSKQQGQRARRRERTQNQDGKKDKPHRAVQRDVDRDWEASFEADMKSADGMDTRPKPGKARAKGKPAGKSNKPNSRKSAVAKAADQKRRTRAKAAKKPVAKPRGFIKK